MRDMNIRMHTCMLLVVLSTLLLSCGTGKQVMKDIRIRKNLEVRKAPASQKTPLKRIAVLPFVSPRFQAEEGAPDVVCSFCGRPLQEHKDFSRAGERLAEYLYDGIRERSTYEIVPLEEVFSNLSFQEESPDPFTDVHFLMEFGKQLGVDALVVGEIIRIKEREGGDYSVLAPASVAFRVKMVRVKDGVELYRVLFDETQKPLSEEPQRLFHWSKIRFRWQTADQLSRAGMRQVAESFPGRVERTQ